jgi:hypothetical protein
MRVAGVMATCRFSRWDFTSPAPVPFVEPGEAAAAQSRRMTMSIAGFPVGQEMNVTYPDFQVSLKLHSVTQMSFDLAEGPSAHKETVSIAVQPLGKASSR